MNKNIPLYLIESFIVASEEASFQLAADRLKITQSTLSKQMILFEELLPHKVFTFDGRRKILTPYGQSLFKALRPKFTQTQELIEQTGLLYSTSKNLHIKICGRGELLDILAVNLIFGGKVTFIPMDNDSALDAVLNRKAEIAIVHTGIDSSEIVMRPFLSNNFKFAISKSLMKLRPKVETELIEKARSLPCILYKAQDTVTEDLMKAWGISFKDLEVNRIYPNYTTLARMVNKAQGWAILPMHTEIDEESNHIISLTMKSPFNRKFYTCYRKELSSSKWMKELLSEIKILSSNY